ncbi:MAG: acyltransferase [Parcubacteria group bacterium]|jgi:acetyltransferase-like isoleucine patch superfamily enzyme
MTTSIDPTVNIFKSEIAIDVHVREFCTIRNSTLGIGCKIYERVSIKKSKIGEGSDINAGTYIENANIGRSVQIAPNCIIVGVTHDFSPEGVDHEDVFMRIDIGDGAWIGAGSIIMPGVKIGQGSVIGAGATVKMDVPDRHVYVGTPSQNKCYPILPMIHP